MADVILVECKHGGYELSRNCPACKGSGYVKVVLGELKDAQGNPYMGPVACLHGGYDLSRNCPACKGSGWAGMVETPEEGRLATPFQ
jgi:hypothetical protein